MKCPRCLNEDSKYFYQGQSRTYCRRCVHLGGYQVESFDQIDGDVLTTLEFELTFDQQKISKAIVRHGLHSDILLEAVCGAGKSECVVDLIKKALESSCHVGWMIARRQVVLQIQERMQNIFKNQKVIAVCEGHTEDLQGDLVILTAHQLYRYPQKFDVLIIDEPDAFPYKGNSLLHDLASNACKGQRIYLTATPDKELLEKETVHLTLDRRPHGRDLVMPKVMTTFKWLEKVLLLVYLMLWKDEKVLIFVPTIRLANRIGTLLRISRLTSQSLDKEKILNAFENDCKGKLVCTTILERGMTFSEVFVIVFDSHHPVFDEASLIQISGRVGRSFQKEKGECVFLATKKSSAIQACLKRIHHHNTA